MLRRFRDHAVNVPQPYGVAEILPGREYLLVTQLLPDATEVLDADLGDEVIYSALRQVRRMWDAGVAHRDVKPSNVLVKERRHTYLVDVAFGELRPSPWRQAVDLANMMLTLALIAGADKSTPDGADLRSARDRRGVRGQRVGDHPAPAAPARPSPAAILLPSSARSPLGTHRSPSNAGASAAFDSPCSRWLRSWAPSCSS